jgi:hypothetical protein
MAIINGRRIDPKSIGNGVYGRELIPHANAIGPARRAIIENNGQVQQINPNRFYSEQELKDKHGRGAKITSMPSRSKGYNFGGRRSQQSKQIITEQVVYLADKVFRGGVEFDEDNANWLVIPEYSLPPRWHHIARSTPLMVVFPEEYPVLPPVGFYMQADIPESPDGHFFEAAYHNAWQEPIQHGWKWYCVYIHNGAWQPARNWRAGDNLFTYFHLIREVLGNEG